MAGEAGDVVDAQLLHQTGPVGLRGLEAYAQDGRNLLRGLTLGDKLEDLALPGAEPLVGKAGAGGGPDGPIRVPFGRRGTAPFKAKAAGLSSRARV